MDTADAAQTLRRLATVIDAHRWDAIAELLDEDFVCRLVHTGEEFDGPSWIRFNADYPGFQSMTLEDLVGDGERAAARAHVVGVTDGREEHFALAQFATSRGGRLVELVEIWTGLGQAAPAGTRAPGAIVG